MNSMPGDADGDPGAARHNPSGPLQTRVFSSDSLDAARWDDFVRAQGSIFSSLDWIRTSTRWLESQGRTRYTPRFFIVERDGAVCAACAVLHAVLVFPFLTGRFVIQGHPIVRADLGADPAVSDALFELIEREARRRRAMTVQGESLWSEWRDRESLTRNGYRVRDLRGWMVDLSQGEAQLSSRWRGAWRNQRNQAAKKHGVVVTEQDDIAAMYALWRETYERDGDSLFAGARDYLEMMYQGLAPKGLASMAFAVKDGKPLCGAITLHWGKTLYSWHAGSVSGQRYGASHLLHWTLMMEGMRRGSTTYHMGGSWLAYSDEKSGKEAENINFFKQGIGAEGHAFCCGENILAPRRYALYRRAIVSAVDRLRAWREQPRPTRSTA